MGSVEGQMHDVEARRMYAKVTEKLFGEPSAPVRIGRYRVEGRLGAGAMGVVYAAVDERLGRRLAIKLLHESFAGDPTGRARLLREAQAMAQLSHPNVVTLFDVGTYGDQVFIAMEFVQGLPLSEWLRKPHTWREVVAVFLAAGRGLAAAHQRGIVQDWNPQAETMFGWPRAEAVGKNVFELLALNPAESPIKAAMERFLQSGLEQVVQPRREIVVNRRDGSEFPPRSLIDNNVDA